MKTYKLLELKLPKTLMVVLIERYQNTQCITVIWYFHGKREVVVGVGVGGLDIRQVVIMLYTVSSRKTHGVSEMNKDR